MNNYILLSGINKNIVELQVYLQSEGNDSTSVTQKANAKSAWTVRGYCSPIYRHGTQPIQNYIHAFTFDNNSMVIYQGLNSLFIFKSVSFSATTPKLSCWHLRRCTKTFVLFWSSPDVITTWVRRYLLTHYTSRNTVKSCFWGPSDAEGPQHHVSKIMVWHVI
jgi:hypothetical protein